MRTMIAKLLRRYGSDMELVGGESPVFRAFFHHTGSKSWQNMEKVFSPLGQIPRGQYMIIAPAGIPLAVGTTLKWNGRRCDIRRLEHIMYRNTIVYQWGLCVEKGSENTWPQ